MACRAVHYAPCESNIDVNDQDDALESTCRLPFLSDGAQGPELRRPWGPIVLYLLVASFGFNIILSGVLLHGHLRQGLHKPLPPQMLYSPAQVALRYEAKKFHLGFGKPNTIYQESPSPDVDKAWTDLYDSVGIIKMTKSSAARLPNSTYPIANDPGYYIGELAVFHQLHCVNRLRQSLYPDYYRKVYPQEFEPLGTLGVEHLSHCVEVVREALMCASDISVIVWQWNAAVKKALPDSRVVHACRDFEAIKVWAMENRVSGGFDPEAYIENEITAH